MGQFSLDRPLGELRKAIGSQIESGVPLGTVEVGGPCWSVGGGTMIMAIVYV